MDEKSGGLSAADEAVARFEASAREFDRQCRHELDRMSSSYLRHAFDAAYLTIAPETRLGETQYDEVARARERSEFHRMQARVNNELWLADGNTVVGYTEVPGVSPRSVYDEIARLRETDAKLSTFASKALRWAAGIITGIAAGILFLGMWGAL